MHFLKRKKETHTLGKNTFRCAYFMLKCIPFLKHGNKYRKGMVWTLEWKEWHGLQVQQTINKLNKFILTCRWFICEINNCPSNSRENLPIPFNG